ncbi:hypothetical protein ACTWJ8_40245 (plasmid) [Streptomyces sp. SDT5-1]|uniref:hypothetical protein n=1 Tax=Streptomyces sp. SDT5-1 TaxID=3406418 RepID=UPI003FD2E7B3
MSSRREVRDFLRELRRAGCTTKRSKSGHWRITGQNGATISCPNTPSCPRSLPNTRAEARRILRVDLP